MAVAKQHGAHHGRAQAVRQAHRCHHVQLHDLIPFRWITCHDVMLCLIVDLGPQVAVQVFREQCSKSLGR